MTEDYVRKQRAEAGAKMEAARILRDTGKTKTGRNAGSDAFRFWQEKLAYFTEMRATPARS